MPAIRMTIPAALLVTALAAPATGAAPEARVLDGYRLRADGVVEVTDPLPAPLPPRPARPSLAIDECVTGENLLPTETCRDHVWATRSPGFEAEDAYTDSALSPDGARLFVLGTTYGESRDLILAAYDTATGAELWIIRWDGPSPWSDLTRALATDGTRVVVAATVHWADEAGYDMTVLSFDAATGEAGWTARYNGPPGGLDDQANDIAMHGGGVFVTGWSNGVGTSSDVLTLALDAETGERRWVARYDHPYHGSDQGNAVLASDAGVFVTGDVWTRESTDPKDVPIDALTVAYDPETGQQRWARVDGRASGWTWDAGRALALAGGRLYVGTQFSGTGMTEAMTQALDPATGERIWSDVYAGPNTGPDWVRGLVAAGDRVYLNGAATAEDSSRRSLVIAYDGATGARRWIDLAVGPTGSGTEGWGAALSPDGSRLYVSGPSWGHTQCEGALVTCHGYFLDYGTIAYDTGDGARAWEARFVGEGIGHSSAYYVGVGYLWYPPQEIAGGVHVVPDGSRVIVAGQSYAEASGADLAPVAYEP